MCSGLQMAASYGAVTGISNVLPVRYDRNAVTAALMAAVPEVTAVLLDCHQGLQPGCDFQVHTATNLVELKSCLSVCYRTDAPGLTRSHLSGEHIWCRFCRACLWTLSAAVYRAAACQSSCSSLWRLNQNDRHTGFLPCSIRPLTGLPRSGQRY